MASIALEDGREELRFCNSYSRHPTLIKLAWELEVEDWLQLLGEEWPSCDNISEYATELGDTPLDDLGPGDPRLRLMMTPAEQAAYDKLPNEVIVYRGCYASNKWGLSWSLRRDVAEKFPTLNRYRQNGQPLLVKARILKIHILALKHDRDEDEVVTWWVRPTHISTTHIRETVV